MSTYEKALKKLEQVEKLWSINVVSTGVEEYLHVPKINDWRQVPTNIASMGVLSSSVDSDESPKELVFLPKGAEIKAHMHPGILEDIMVIDGTVHYKIFNGDKVIEKGVVNKFTRFKVQGHYMHTVFTTLTNAYMIITFSEYEV